MSVRDSNINEICNTNCFCILSVGSNGRWGHSNEITTMKGGDLSVEIDKTWLEASIELNC